MEKQNGQRIEREELKVSSVQFKTDEEDSQDQLIEMPDIMSMRVSEVQLKFYQDLSEDSRASEQRSRDIVLERQQQPLQDDVSVANSNMSFSSPIQ